MYLLYPIFIILSLAGMTVVLVLKIREIGMGRQSFLGRLSVKGDAKIQFALTRLEDLSARFNLKNVRAAAKTAAAVFVYLLGKIMVWLSARYIRIHRKLSTKFRERPVSKNGIVSFFLKNVSESSKGKEDKTHGS